MTNPLISVVIPVYNDPDGLRDTLESLVSQGASNDVYELLVVDNGSTDTTPEVIAEFEDRYSELLVGLEETTIQSSYAARNTGIKRARGDVVLFIDADITVERTCIDNVRKAFDNSDIEYLGCNVEMYIPEGKDSFWARYDLAMGLPVEYYLENKRFAPTCALAVRNHVFESVGRFDESLVSGGDKEFGNRIQTAGLSMGYAENIVVRHPTRTTLSDHLRKAARIGRGQAQLSREHDLAEHPLSLVRFLPPAPSRIQQRCRDADSVPLYYVVSYLLKLVQTLFAIREWQS